MKATITVALAGLIGLLPLPALSASEHDAHAGHMDAPSKASAESPMSEGVVKKVDKAAGKITISHGPLVNLGMPAMTMVFRVKEAAWIEQMKEGDKIRFLADAINNNLTIVRFESVK